MDYLLCVPAAKAITREDCEKVHNILASLSELQKLRIVPEPVKAKQAPSPNYYKKYRIYKHLPEPGGNGEAYLLKEEEDMILNACRNKQEQELMKGCIYAYCYPALTVLKSFRDKDKKK